MIRPVLNVDLPGIVYALDRRARARQSAFAHFVVAPDMEEPRSGFAALLSALLPITPSAHTWICEDHWRLLGLAQARERPGAQAWDLAYLAAILPSGSASTQQSTGASTDDVLLELLQYALNAAIRHGVHRCFASIHDDSSDIELFAKVSFQRYARELSYWLPGANEGVQALELHQRTTPLDPERAVARLLHRSARDADAQDAVAADPRVIRPDVPLRRWSQHDAWGLLRLYDAATPKRVQLAESLTSDEFVHTRAAGGRTWHFPLLEPASAAFVADRGVRLGGWLRLRHGRGAQPHMVSVMAHPDDPDVAVALLAFGLKILAQQAPRPVFCQVRDYETAVVDALRLAGFEHCDTHALLVRHLTMRALRRREILGLEARMAYGVRGFGTTPSRLSKGEETHYARTEAR